MLSWLTEFVSKFGLAIAVAAASAIASFVVGRWWGRYRAAQQWASKEFLGRIIVSLNMIADGRLKIRTVFEKSLEEVFLNPIAIEKVQTAARQTTDANPMLPIAKEDCWYLLNFVLNAISEYFAGNLIRYDAGEKVKLVNYAICLTCEVVGDERIRKVRAMMVRRELLEDFPFPDSMPQLENPWHETRVHTLRTMAKVYRTNPEQFLHLEICV